MDAHQCAENHSGLGRSQYSKLGIKRDIYLYISQTFPVTVYSFDIAHLNFWPVKVWNLFAPSLICHPVLLYTPLCKYTFILYIRMYDILFTELWVVSMDHLQRVWPDSRERLPFRAPGSVPLVGTCLCSNCWDQIYRTCHIFTRRFTPWYPLVLSRFAFKFPLRPEVKTKTGENVPVYSIQLFHGYTRGTVKLLFCVSGEDLGYCCPRPENHY